MRSTAENTELSGIGPGYRKVRDSVPISFHNDLLLPTDKHALVMERRWTAPRGEDGLRRLAGRFQAKYGGVGAGRLRPVKD